MTTIIRIDTKLSQSYEFSLILKIEVVLLNGKGNQSFIHDFVIFFAKERLSNFIAFKHGNS